MIKTSYDKEADAVYLYFTEKEIVESKELDKGRIIDFSEHGELRGIELLGVSKGVNTDNLPHRDEIEQELYNKGIKTFA